MTNRKNYNSILFLTVYLGLVLVGGSSHVFAHAATNSLFDIRNEIEFKEDLDNKPENDEISNLTDEDFPALFAQLLKEIKSSAMNGNVQLPLQPNFYVEAGYSFSGRCNTSFTNSDSPDKYFKDIVYEKFWLKLKPKVFELADSPTNRIRDIKISLQANSANLSLKISFNKSDSSQFAEFLNNKFSSTATRVEEKLLKQIYENTKVLSSNNQVFIVTRLPRGSIDSLLK
jgi:hypothetical protein